MRRPSPFPLCVLITAIGLHACSGPRLQTASQALPSDRMGLEAIDAFIAKQKIDASQPGWRTRLPKPPKVPFDSSKHYFWQLETNVGNIRIKLMPEIAPMHVSSTLYLARLGFYDGIPFHRVVPGFVAQGGDPTLISKTLAPPKGSDILAGAVGGAIIGGALGGAMGALGVAAKQAGSSGGPGYQYEPELDPKMKHDRPGLLSMGASSGKWVSAQLIALSDTGVSRTSELPS